MAYKPRPVTIDKIVGGQHFIRVEVWSKGIMALEHHVFYGRPIKRMGSWWFRTRRNDRQLDENLDCLFNFSSASDAGLDPNHIHNHHRTFRFNMRNEHILADIVKRQAISEYLILIGAVA